MPVPKRIFEETWLKGNFLIPADKSVRIELRQQLETYFHTGAMYLPKNKEVQQVLRARIAALDAHDAVLSGN